LQGVGQQRKLRMSLQSLAAIVANDLYGHVAVGIIRYYTPSLIGGQELETEPKIRHIGVLEPSERHPAMPANISYCHWYAS
jgi:hypothetical protein